VINKFDTVAGPPNVQNCGERTGLDFQAFGSGAVPNELPSTITSTTGLFASTGSNFNNTA
jgi:hypothetical protein